MPDTIAQDVVTAVTPRQPDNNVLTAPVRETLAEVQADPKRQYLSGQPLFWLASYLHALPPWHDDLEYAFGRGIWSEMVKHPTIWSSIQTIRFGCLSQDLELHDVGANLKKNRPKRPEPSTKGEKDFAAAVKYYCDDLLRRLRVRQYLYKMYDSLVESYCIGEKQYDEAPPTPIEKPFIPAGGALWRLRAIKVKPQHNVAIVVDPFMNVAGYVGVRPGSGGNFIIMPQFWGADSSQLKNVLPADKCALMTYYPDKEHPYGHNPLRPAYAPWWASIQTWGQTMSSSAQFGGAALVGEAAPEAAPVVRKDHTGATVYSNGVPVRDYPQDTMLAQLECLRSGGVVTLPSGAKVTPLFIPDALKNLIALLSLCDTGMVTAIHGATRATREAEHGSRADSQTGKDILDQVVMWGRYVGEEHIRSQVLEPAVELTFGQEALQYVPDVSLGDSSAEDFAGLATAVATLYDKGYPDPSQIPGIDALMGLSARTPEEMRIREEKLKQEHQSRQAGIDAMKQGQGQDNQQGQDGKGGNGNGGQNATG